MKNKQTYIKQIPDYLDGLLTDQEQAAFEAQLQQDPSLRKELELHRQVVETLGKSQPRSFRERLEIMNRETPAPDVSEDASGKTFSLRLLTGIAAAILVLLVAGVWWFSPTASSQELLASHLANFDPADILPAEYSATRSLADNSESQAGPEVIPDTVLDEARRLFSQKAYTDALSAMNKIDTGLVLNKDAFHCEKGVLYVLNHQPQQAISSLRQIKADELKNTQHWFIALSYLQLDQIEKCRAELQKLMLQKSNAWKPDAKDLLESL